MVGINTSPITSPEPEEPAFQAFFQSSGWPGKLIFIQNVIPSGFSGNRLGVTNF